MRGYSLHDLYAKALALLGLGMLAGTGALVDYWPSEGGTLPLPAAASVSMSAPAITLTAEAANAVQTPPAAARPRQIRTTFVRSASVVEAPLALPMVAPLALAPSGSLGVYVPLPALESAVMPRTLEHAVAVEPVALVDAEAVQQASYALVEYQGAPVARATDESESGSLITGAFRKTGSSLRKTGAKTGASIVGALRGFGGAFSGAVRRALPVI